MINSSATGSGVWLKQAHRWDSRGCRMPAADPPLPPERAPPCTAPPLPPARTPPPPLSPCAWHRFPRLRKPLPSQTVVTDHPSHSQRGCSLLRTQRGDEDERDGRMCAPARPAGVSVDRKDGAAPAEFVVAATEIDMTHTQQRQGRRAHDTRFAGDV